MTGEELGFATEMLFEEGALDEVVVTNTIPLSDAAMACSKIRQLSVAPLIAQVIQRIALGQSVMNLFREQEEKTAISGASPTLF